jgi:hypothetical protein
MNAKRKLERLFRSARNEIVPPAGEDFAGAVMRAIRRERQPEPFSLSDQLANLFPRLATAAALMIAVCVVADYCLSNFLQSDLSSSTAEMTQEWLFAVR